MYIYKREGKRGEKMTLTENSWRDCWGIDEEAPIWKRGFHLSSCIKLCIKVSVVIEEEEDDDERDRGANAILNSWKRYVYSLATKFNSFTPLPIWEKWNGRRSVNDGRSQLIYHSLFQIDMLPHQHPPYLSVTHSHNRSLLQNTIFDQFF